MADQIYADAVQINGSEDEVQLKVQAHSTQTQPLQQWQDDLGNTLTQVSPDGQLQIGDLAMGTPAALIEANKQTTLPSTDVKQGIQSRGEITGQILDSLAWIVQELELLGSGGVESVQAAIRARIEHNNSGNSTSAELRAGDFEASNQSGSSVQRVGQVTGVSGTASNQENAFTQNAVGIEGTVNNALGGDIAEASVLRAKSPTNAGTITELTGLEIEDMDAGTNNFAIRTGKGVVEIGDVIDIVEQSTTPANPSTGSMRLYLKNDGKVYALDSSGNEKDLTNSITNFVDLSDTPANYVGSADRWLKVNASATGLEFANAPSSNIPAGIITPFGGPEHTVPAGWLLCDGRAVSRTGYAALFSALGGYHGHGDGSTTFNIPDLRGLFPLGKDNMGGTSANRVTLGSADYIGSMGGTQNHTLTVNEMPSHNHEILTREGGAQGNTVGRGTIQTQYSATTQHRGGNQPHNNMPPFRTLNYIIKA